MEQERTLLAGRASNRTMSRAMFVLVCGPGLLALPVIAPARRSGGVLDLGTCLPSPRSRSASLNKSQLDQLLESVSVRPGGGGSKSPSDTKRARQSG
jgi:hypothetical protein